MDKSLSKNFNITELESALKSVKPGTAAGFDGYIRSSSEILVKDITILKTGKDGSDPAHYRPISLLSVVHNLLERLQRIQPLIEAVTPVHQAGFR